MHQGRAQTYQASWPGASHPPRWSCHCCWPTASSWPGRRSGPAFSSWPLETCGRRAKRGLRGAGRAEGPAPRVHLPQPVGEDVQQRGRVGVLLLLKRERPRQSVSRSVADPPPVPCSPLPAPLSPLTAAASLAKARAAPWQPLSRRNASTRGNRSLGTARRSAMMHTPTRAARARANACVRVCVCARAAAAPPLLLPNCPRGAAPGRHGGAGWERGAALLA